MSVLKEIADSIKAVAEGLQHIRTVAKAVNDGLDYLKHRHPEIKKDLAATCAEMRNTSNCRGCGLSYSDPLPFHGCWKRYRVGARPLQ